MPSHEPYRVGDLTRQVATFATHTSFADLPAEVVRQAKLVVLDTLGALLAASDPRYSAGRIMVEFATRIGGREESTIIGRGFRSSRLNAAMVNGLFGYYCDIEAHHPEAVVHPAATIVPTCLALGEAEKVDGQRFLLAFVVGTEVECRASLALNPRALYDRGFHPSCVAGAIGAAVAASRLLDLDAGQHAIALGLAGQQACGLLAWKEDFSEHARPFNHSLAARNGITAATLARSGFGGPPDPFEGRYNLFRAFSREGEARPGELVRNLAREFLLMGLAFKRYSCCAFLHPGLDALATIMDAHRLTSADIDQIVLRFPKNGTELIDGTELRSHSAQYILPVAAVHRRVSIDDILQDQRTDPEVARLTGSMRVVGDDVLDRLFPERYASTVEVITRGGATFAERVDYAAGTPQNPLTEAEVEEKFFALSHPRVGHARAAEIRAIVRALDELDDVNALGGLLANALPPSR